MSRNGLNSGGGLTLAWVLALSFVTTLRCLLSVDRGSGMEEVYG